MFSKNNENKPTGEEVSDNIDKRPNRQWKRTWNPRFGTAPVVRIDANSEASLVTNNGLKNRRHN